MFYPKTRLASTALLCSKELPQSRRPQILDSNDRFLVVLTQDSFFYQYVPIILSLFSLSVTSSSDWAWRLLIFHSSFAFLLSSGFAFPVICLFALSFLWVHASSARSSYIFTHMIPASLCVCVCLYVRCGCFCGGWWFVFCLINCRYLVSMQTSTNRSGVVVHQIHLELVHTILMDTFRWFLGVI